MSNKLNWERKQSTTRYIGSYGERFKESLDKQRSCPTEKQRKFFKALVAKCYEKGLKPYEEIEGKPKSREEYKTAISELSQLLGISTDDKVFERNKQEKNKSRSYCNGCLHERKNKNLYPCSGCFIGNNYCEIED